MISNSLHGREKNIDGPAYIHTFDIIPWSNKHPQHARWRKPQHVDSYTNFTLDLQTLKMNELCSPDDQVIGYSRVENLSVLRKMSFNSNSTIIKEPLLCAHLKFLLCPPHLVKHQIVLCKPTLSYSSTFQKRKDYRKFLKLVANQRFPQLHYCQFKLCSAYNSSQTPCR